MFFGKSKAALKKLAKLEATGRYLDALDVLTMIASENRDPEYEERLVYLRNEAYAELKPSKDLPDLSADVDLFEGVNGIPEIEASELTTEALKSAIVFHGSMLVRGLVSSDTADILKNDIIQALASRGEGEESGDYAEALPWWKPFTPRIKDEAQEQRRNFLKSCGAMPLTDSPRAAFDLLETYKKIGLHAIVTEYLGERPMFTDQKTTLRRVHPEAVGGWHQDGAFLGEGIKALNVWLALSNCGPDASCPGLDVLACRLNHIVETGTEDAHFPWSVGASVVEKVRGDTPVVRVDVRPGDILLFDHMNLHKTGGGPEMTDPRYAIETWFFAPSSYPLNKHPPFVF